MTLKLLRYALALVFMFAGGSKVLQPVLFKAVIQSYYAIPDGLAVLLAIAVPWVEIMAALSLLVNWKVRYSSGLIAVMSVYFLGLMLLNYGQVLPFGCGCFGFNGAELVGIFHIAREFIILCLAGAVFYLHHRQAAPGKGAAA